MSRIDEYFNGSYSLYLDKVEYVRISENDEEVALNIKDDIEIKLHDKFQGIEGIIIRKLSFEPRSLFEITVSFGVFLEFNDKYKENEIVDIEEIKKEFIDEQSAIINIIMSRISLLISQLTSSYGERPIVTPPSIM